MEVMAAVEYKAEAENRLAKPDASNVTVISVHVMVGGVRSGAHCAMAAPEPKAKTANRHAANVRGERRAAEILHRCVFVFMNSFSVFIGTKFLKTGQTRS